MTNKFINSAKNERNLIPVNGVDVFIRRLLIIVFICSFTNGAFAQHIAYKEFTFLSKTVWGITGEPGAGSEATQTLKVFYPAVVTANTPAIIHVNNSGGEDDKTIKYFSKTLPENGVIEIALNSFQGRATGSTSVNQKVVYTGVQAEDALNALRYLRNTEEFAQRKIGVMGHSRGAHVATSYTPFLTFLRYAKAADIRFDFHIGLGIMSKTQFEKLS